MGAQVGDTLPDVVVFEGSPNDKKKITDYFAGKKGVLFGVPGLCKSDQCCVQGLPKES